MNDPIFVEDSRHWLEQTTIALFDHPKCTFEDKLFILHHILKCGPGFGRWAARLFQPDPPILETDKKEYLSCNPVHCQTEAKDGMEAIHHILIMISTILTPIRDRENLIREAFPNLAASQNRNTLSPAKRTSSPKINQNDKVSSGPKDLWVIVDSEGEDDEENDDNFRENDLVSLLNQVPLDSVFRYMLKIRIQDGVENGNFDYLYVTDIAMHLLTMSVFLLGSYTRRQELLDIGTANPSFTNFFNCFSFLWTRSW